MIRLFKHYIPVPLFLLGAVDYLLLFLSAEAAWRIRLAQAGLQISPLAERLGVPLTFMAVMAVSALAVGLYEAEGLRAWRMTATRMIVSFFLGFIALSVIFFIAPQVALWRSIAILATMISFASMMAVRTLFERMVRWERFRRRIVVIGAGRRARKLFDVSRTRGAGFEVAAFVQVTGSEPAVPDPLPREALSSLRELVELHSADQVVLAIEERRGALPVAELLQVKLTGTGVCEMSTFLERETGRVDLGSVTPSWLIFSDGFLGAQQRALALKRLTDILASALLLLLTSPIVAVTAAAVWLSSRGPIFYRQERVGHLGKSFAVIKFRSMRQDAEPDGQPRWALQSDPRVTVVGRMIRATRIDEIPQIFNVLRGDMSFVGPRPERPFFVGELSEQIPFYNERHVVKPGITGWAQLNYPYGASVDDARQKLEYDLYYIKNYSPFLDLLILIQTLRVVMWRDGAR